MKAIVALLLGGITIGTALAKDGGAAPATQSAAAVTSPAPADETLTSDEYLKLGIAAHDRIWDVADASRASKVLSLLAKSSIYKLPRLGDRRSGEVFARMVSPQNLVIYTDLKRPLSMRFQDALGYYEANSALLGLYLDAAAKDPAFDPEVFELVCGALRTTVVVFDLVDEMLPTLDKNAANYPKRMQGLERMKRGLASIVTGCFQMLAEQHSVADKLKLLRSMNEAYPKVVPKLLDESRREVMVQLDRLNEKPELKALQPSLGELRTKVKAAVGAIKEP